ncbi:hypothetical protein ACLIA0_05240 [Bacillaceae bacterium W0354]
MFKYISAGVLLSIIILGVNEYTSPYFIGAMISGILSVVAVGIFGLVWKDKTDNFSIRPIIVTGIFVFCIFFYLSGSEMLVGPLIVISLVFIVVGLFGLLLRAN